MQAQHLRGDIRARMRRAHAYLLSAYLIACLCGLLIAEAWRWGRREWRHRLRRAKLANR